MNKFSGCWKLAMTEFRKPDGSNIRPLGDDPQGIIIYTQEGTMSAQLHKAERAHFLKNDIFGGTPTETAEAYCSYVAYYGTYEIDQENKTISHYVQGSTFPNQSGSTLERFFEFSDNDGILTLKTAPFPVNDIKLTGILVWKRIA